MSRSGRVPRTARLAPNDVLDQHDADDGRAELQAAVGSGVRWMGPTQVLIQVIRVGATLALSWLLEPDDFGTVALVSVVTGLFERVLGDTGTTTALVRHRVLSQGLASSVLFWNIAVGLITSTFFVLAGAPIARALGDPTAAGLVRVLGLLALVNSVAYVPRALFRRRLEFRRLAAVNLLNALVTGTATIAFALADWGVWSIVLGNLSGSVVATIVAWGLVQWRPSLHFSRARLSEISGFSIRLSLQNVFGYVSFAGDRFIIGRFIGTTELGYYGFANRFMLYPVQTSAQTYRQVVFPNLARIQDDFEALARAYRRSVRGIGFILFPVCATVAAVGEPLVNASLAEQWRPVGPVLSIVAITAGLQAVAATTGSLYNVRGRADLSLRWQIASSVVLLIAYVVGAQWGVQGVAWGYLTGTAVLTYPAFAIPLSLIGARTSRVMGDTLTSGLASAVAGGLAYGTVQVLAASGASNVAQVGVAGSISLATYGLYVVLLRPPALKDLLHLLRN